jgi:NCS1 family nucleobase:cation symporter-1
MSTLDQSIIDSPLANGDLAPTTPERRTWGTYDFAALWVGLSIVTTTYTLASGLIAAGMTWWQGLLTVSLGNLIVLIPMLLNGHPGTKYGIPYPVLVRSSFGIRGANVAAMARALVACGWFGIQTWIGALAVDGIMTALWSGWADVGPHKAIAFGAFWLIELVIILRGIEGIRFLERTAAPLLLGGSVALLIWGFDAGGGIGHVFSNSSKLVTDNQSFWTLFAPGLAANIGYWITLSLNIPDFTRYARDQKSQVLGQSIAMPLTMTAFSFVGIAVTAATVVIYGEAIWDPVALVVRLLGDLPVLLVLAMIVIVIAQLSTNMAANVVSPSNDFSNLSPRQISFRLGGVITAVIGIISFPWKLYSDVGAYIFTWLVGYGSLLAAFGAVMIVDYWIIRKTVLDVVDLYKPGPASRYWYAGGFNVRALVAVAIGVIPVVPGFIHAATTKGGVVADPNFLDQLYRYGVFVGFGLAAVSYYLISLPATRESPAPALAE